MPALEFNKSQRREIRRLSGLAHERELAAATSKLAEDCDRWRKGEINVFTFVQLIHKFHDGA